MTRREAGDEEMRERCHGYARDARRRGLHGALARLVEGFPTLLD